MSLFSTLLFFVIPAFAMEPISRAVVDLSKTTELHIAPGRISVLTLPEAIAEAKVGAPQKLKVLPSASDPNELTLFWIDPRTFRTNVIVRTTQRTFVFDVVPTVSGHQDIVQVRGAFGAPTMSSHGRVIVETPIEPTSKSKSASSRIVYEGKFQ